MIKLLSEHRAAKMMGVATATLKKLPGMPRIEIGKRRKYRECDIETYLTKMAKPVEESSED